jgi:hypothetical protein
MSALRLSERTLREGISLGRIVHSYTDPRGPVCQRLDSFYQISSECNPKALHSARYNSEIGDFDERILLEIFKSEEACGDLSCPLPVALCRLQNISFPQKNLAGSTVQHKRSLCSHVSCCDCRSGAHLFRFFPKQLTQRRWAWSNR